MSDWNAAAYHTLSDPHIVWGRRVLQRIPLRGDEVLVDVGCGTGRLTALAAERLPRGRIIGIDVSASMLEVAKHGISGSAGLQPGERSRVSFLRADATALPLNQAADVIFSTATFHWVLDHPALFRSLHGALKRGGILEAQCGGGPNVERLMSRAGRITRQPAFAPFLDGWTGPWEFSDAETAAARLREAGFSGVQTSVEPAFVTMDDRKTYQAFIETVIIHRHLARLPPELRGGFSTMLTDEAAGDDPPFTIDYWRLNLHGVKP